MGQEPIYLEVCSLADIEQPHGLRYSRQVFDKAVSDYIEDVVSEGNSFVVYTPEDDVTMLLSPENIHSRVVELTSTYAKILPYPKVYDTISSIIKQIECALTIVYQPLVQEDVNIYSMKILCLYLIPKEYTFENTFI